MDRVGQVLVETYRVERLIAEGGMAAVYEATHLRVPKRFAVKFLKMSLVNNTEALLRFRREAEIIATFDHPGIVQLIDYNVSDDGQPYIVLEFLDGEHLGVRMSRGKLVLEEAVRIAAAVSSALTAAHLRDITHRDLKPENIIICKGENVKVVDFGVAKLRHGPELTAMNVVVGTVGYMSPEQISGGMVDPRTDQFALASIVYGMLAGLPAFELQGSVAAQAMAILHHHPPALSSVSPAVNAALQRGMAKNPFHRYATTAEFMDALAAAAGSTSEVQLPEGFETSPTTDPLALAARDELPELPELPADATSVSVAPVAEDAPTPTALQSMATMQLDAVVDPEVVIPPIVKAELPASERPTIPPTGMMLPPLPPISERPTMLAMDIPRPTMKSMSAVTAPPDPA